MYQFWNDVIAPVIEATGARRVVEVGALRGENTQQMLDRLGPDVELHVIDPTPDFDPRDHETRFAGRYVFHRDFSVNVLGHLPPMDVALIDGDHNWYTVHTELQLLAQVAHESGTPFPVAILHDVGWPYGRRDLYYDPGTIPADYRHPWRRAGIRRGQSDLVPFGAGLNAELPNAEHEDGPRNGVMSALEDFVAEHNQPLRVVVLPIYFGLAIVAEEALLGSRPALREFLDGLDGPAGKDLLIRLGEDIRLDSAVIDQVLIRQRDRLISVLTSRYLDMIKSTIVDDHHRGRAGLDHLHRCLDRMWDTGVTGDVLVCGAGRGGSTQLAAAFLEAHDQEPFPGHLRRLWVIDRFDGSEGRGDLDLLRKRLERLDLLRRRVQLLQGDPATTAAHVSAAQLGLIVLGPSLGADVDVVLDLLHPRLAHAGILVADAPDPALAEAVARYAARHGITGPIDRDGSGGFAWTKAESVAEPVPGPSAAPGGVARKSA
jgi:Macrocin-O-methyltransferase (TylF)